MSWLRTGPTWLRYAYAVLFVAGAVAGLSMVRNSPEVKVDTCRVIDQGIVQEALHVVTGQQLRSGVTRGGTPYSQCVFSGTEPARLSVAVSRFGRRGLESADWQMTDLVDGAEGFAAEHKRRLDLGDGGTVAVSKYDRGHSAVYMWVKYRSFVVEAMGVMPDADPASAINAVEKVVAQTLEGL
ncbi:hypothetical protein AB0B31_27635 [Catellatospora citrea]|uniref:hypothetical protein n=1 Tax=Catellatospora citrea TaxID=53366 RepID=UPI0033FF2BDC